MEKFVIYQMVPRVAMNRTPNPRSNGSIEENGCGKLADINGHVLRSIRRLGATHVWYTGVIEHAHATDYTNYGIEPVDNPNVVKGKAGSPYAIRDYYDIDPDIAVDPRRRMEEFEALVERTHRAGMKVLIDFVPNHVARCYTTDAAPADAPAPFGADDDTNVFFSPTNDFYYMPGEEFAPYDVDLGSGADAYREYPAKASGNDCFTAHPSRNDWYETVKLNYGIEPRWGGGFNCHFDPVPPLWYKMVHILKYWASKNIDGFRCDMVHMVPVEFWHWAIPQVKADYPTVIFIAEIYEPALYRPYIEYGGFDYLYDKVGLYDTLRAIEQGHQSAAAITGCWQSLGGQEQHMLNFLENHDEQRFASTQYAGDAMRVVPSLVVSATLTAAPMMIYFGQELGEPATEAEGFSGLDGRTTIFDYWSLERMRRWLGDGKSPMPSDNRLTVDEKRLRGIYSRVLNLAMDEPALRRGSMFDLMYVNYHSAGLDPWRQYFYLRHDSESGQLILVGVNFGDRQADADVMIPAHAFECLGIKPGRYKAIDLLTDSSPAEVELAPDVTIRVTIPPHGATLLNFK
ncbi:MAG: alpha-amylase family protein [Paramuribaculum sp.]|nr:alpha-amylase family protein [Paramuribaculum sp.]